jgi:hypothetical protein
MLAAAQFGQSHTTNAILLLGEVTGKQCQPQGVVHARAVLR